MSLIPKLVQLQAESFQNYGSHRIRNTLYPLCHLLIGEKHVFKKPMRAVGRFQKAEDGEQDPRSRWYATAEDKERER